MFGKNGCITSGFIMYFIGTAGIYIMVAISIERFMIIYKPMSIKKITHKVLANVIGICMLLGIFWSVLPIFGWSRYSLEGVGTSCSVEWYERSLNVISYNVAMFLFVFFVPLLVIIGTNLKLIMIVKY
jgi:c-opsin